MNLDAKVFNSHDEKLTLKTVSIFPIFISCFTAESEMTLKCNRNSAKNNSSQFFRKTFFFGGEVWGGGGRKDSEKNNPYYPNIKFCRDSHVKKLP